MLHLRETDILSQGNIYLPFYWWASATLKGKSSPLWGQILSFKCSIQFWTDLNTSEVNQICLQKFVKSDKISISIYSS